MSGSLCGPRWVTVKSKERFRCSIRGCAFSIVVEINLLIENGEISGLFDVGGASGNQPQRVIVEAAADIRVAFLGKRLVLVVGTAVFKLGRCNVDDTFSCTSGIRCTNPSRS
jgi:hypothetical protein